MKKIFYLTIIVSAGLLSACKKSSKTPIDTTPTRINHDELNRIKDSVYLFTQEAYLWYDAIPAMAAFNPHSFAASTDVAELTSEVDALSQYKINPATKQPYEYYADDPGTAKYSFIDDGTVSGELGGTNGDYGFSVLYQEKTDLRIKYVYPGSAADKAGVKRGYQITKINARTDIDYDNSNGPNLTYVVNAIFNSKAVNLTLRRPDNTTFDVSLNVGNYTVNPVLTYKTIDLGNDKKVGYIVFNMFTVPENAGPQLLQAFNQFTTDKITDLVVDLRYNGGGAVATAEYLDDLIVPAAKNGTEMFTEYYNDKLQKDNHPLLSKQFNIPQGYFATANNRANFAKVGTLDISRVFFIITNSTASASELTINNLRPHMDVKFIGSTSYGKPVGFFAINIGQFQLYVPEFETKNSAGVGGYYAGMTPGTTDYPGKADIDDVTKDFGDTTEVLLNHAITFIKTGDYDVPTPKTHSLSKSTTMTIDQRRQMTLKLDEHLFKGMVGKKNLVLKELPRK